MRPPAIDSRPARSESSRFSNAWIIVAVALAGVARACALNAQDEAKESLAGLRNGGFEDWERRGTPSGWEFTPSGKLGRSRIERDPATPREGLNSAALTATESNDDTNQRTILTQSVNAEPFVGHRVRFQAFLRTADIRPQTLVHLLVRIEGTTIVGTAILPAARLIESWPIQSSSWQAEGLVVDVEPGDEKLQVGLELVGPGRVWIDAAYLEIVSAETPLTSAAMGPSLNRAQSGDRVFVPWLVLPVVGIALMALSHTGKWPLARFAFRFSIAYWLLYFLPQPISSLIPIWGSRLEERWVKTLVEPAVRWTALRGLGIRRELVWPIESASGDTTFAFVRVLLIFAAALAAAVIWTALDQSADDDARLKDGLRSYLRYVLGLGLIALACATLHPVNGWLPPPSFDQLARSYADSSPQGLWLTFVGSSPAFVVYLGVWGILAGLLLLWRRTAVAGAMAAAAISVNGVAIALCYDVPVKLVAAHWLLAAWFILLPAAPRLLQTLFRNRSSEASMPETLAHAPRARRVQSLAKACVLMLGVVWPLFELGWAIQRDRFGQGERPALVGSWRVGEFLVNGTPLPPLEGNPIRWSTASFYPRRESGNGLNMFVRTMDRMLYSSPCHWVESEGVLHPSGSLPEAIPERLQFQIHDDRLIISCQIAGAATVVKLLRVRPEDNALSARGFRWINDHPFVR